MKREIHSLLRHSVTLRPSNSRIFTLTCEPISYRRPDLGVLGDFEIAHFERILQTKAGPGKALLSKSDNVEAFNTDYTRKFRGNSKLVLLPSERSDLVESMKLCNLWKLGVVPQGGNSSLLGTSVPSFDEVVISTRKMNQILSVDSDTGLVICEAGVMPIDLERVLNMEKTELTLPIDLGSLDICTIGGNAATNARGIKSVQHPDFRNSIVGLEAVLANGSILNSLEGSRNNLIGVDLKQCLIGTEGTFGIISKVAFKCPQKPKSTEMLLIVCERYETIVEILQLARINLAETLSAFEYMNYDALQIIQRESEDEIPTLISELCPPRKAGKKFHAVLVEASSATEWNVIDLMKKYAERLGKLGCCETRLISENMMKPEQFWKIRKSVIDACLQTGQIFKFDLKFSSQHMPELVRMLEAVCSAEHSSDVRSQGLQTIRDIVIFGQLASGNIHIVLTMEPSMNKSLYDPENPETNRIPQSVIRIQAALCNWLRNSISGGFLAISRNLDGKQTRWLHQLGVDDYGLNSSDCRQLQIEIKKAWDPKGIMNPYKIWPFVSY